MEQGLINEFIEKVKIESKYKKFIENGVISKLFKIFNSKCEKQYYSNNIDNPLELSLEFYKNYNLEYFKIITNGIKNKKIILDRNIHNSFTDIEENVTYINLYGNDGDLFVIVHEFAHFIDRNSNPNIIPNEFSFLGEVFSLYMEKKLELWLDEKYNDLISIRRNNRLFYETDMLKIVKNELKYEKMYIKKGNIDSKNLKLEEVKKIMKYNFPNIVNYLLRYPIGNILSNYLINNNVLKSDRELCLTCLNVNLYEVLNEYKNDKYYYNASKKL